MIKMNVRYNFTNEPSSASIQYNLI